MKTSFTFLCVVINSSISVLFAQDESTCVVFGMPKVAISMGAASSYIPLEEISKHTCQKIRN
jgi:chemotaxis response regulator CheB